MYPSTEVLSFGILGSEKFEPPILTLQNSTLDPNHLIGFSTHETSQHSEYKPSFYA